MLDVPTLCAGLVVLGIALYVILDGVDLGVGILFPLAPDDKSRNVMMSSIAPIWDGNETWLIYGGGILFAAFPTAYAIYLPAFYIPLTIMLIALIFRGVAFEFRLKAIKSRIIWDWSFHVGSVVAALSQGIMLGAIIDGIKVEDNRFAGSAFDCFSSFGITTGFALVVGYALLGSTWTIMKTTGGIHDWARQITKPIAVMVLGFILMVSIKTPFEYPHIFERWFSFPTIVYLAPIPLLTTLLGYWLVRGVINDKDTTPFNCAVGIFILSLIGLIVSIYPNMIMPNISYYDLSTSPKSQQFVLTVLLVSLPIVLGYTWYVYKIFKGKVSPEDSYYK